MGAALKPQHISHSKVLYTHRAWERTLANKRRHDWAMIQFGASTEEVLERWERGQEGEDSMGLDLDWDFRPLI